MKIGKIDLKNNLILAPMAGITDMAFRRICKEYGADLVYTEMVSAKGLYYNDAKTHLLTQACEEERPVSLQIFGSDPEIMGEVAKKISSNADIIDINMGCPAPKVVKNDDGSRLMLNPDLIDKITKSVVKSSSVPVTVKIRKGWDNDHINAKEVAQIAENNGVSAIAIHGRTREEYYTGKADLKIIKVVKESVKIPVIGNGDITDVDSARRMFEETGCDAIMIGRGAIGNPWIFRNIINGSNERPETKEIYEVIEKHYNYLTDLKGEYVAVREMRKHISYYIKNLPDATAIRRAVNETETKVEVLDIMRKYLA